VIETSTLVAFVLLNTSFALIPGPDVLCILSNAVTRGQRAGAGVCLGIATGCLFHVACATLGLSAVLLAVPTAFFAVKLAGAAYLLWLGWQMLRHPVPVTGAASPHALRSPFVQGVLSNVLNPKIAIFFVAILPQFIAPERGNVAAQALLLGLVSIASGTAVNLVTAALGAKARAFLLARERWFRRLQQAAGGMLIALGLRVALERAR
jgi:threonine/homoserine/homoserine lactone efflux protein